MTNTRSTMLQLGYLGLLPFLLSLLLVMADRALFGLSGQQFFIAYSAVILSFLSGVLWGNGIDHCSHRLSRNALILSNLFVLIAWGALLQGNKNAPLAIILLAMGYVAVWYAEKLMREIEHDSEPKGYQLMRGKLTGGVVLMHGLVLIA
ncbi:DUF3429 domain-containing protein [Vibrio sp. CAU 1672]|uniref:DUF3429 domain-containing protein n=1 Tax=Vibrio sp. CAU 1672 TaxID=3032594 RepID=UPI0023DA8D78|nr:DUF3429 domain-containing protein [Vibrio sp. CAU 1672]MDF2152716.1 DUF3429 domain-containing protein [Vibrio sp. CAU 1672]